MENWISWGIDWALVPSTLPPREMKYQRLLKLRNSIGIIVPPTFPEKKVAVTVPANTTVALLLDQTLKQMPM